MKNLTITYWKNLRTNVIYKYFGDSKPMNHETAWARVTCWDYEQSLQNASENYFDQD